MRSLIVTIASLALTAGVLTNAYLHKRQFYPSVVYITKSSPSMAILYLQALVAVIILGKVMRQIFFSQLRSAEMEHLIERSWYAVTETCLAFTVFRDDFSPRFVALFTILLFLKCFHWLGEDRIDYMERSPVITLLFHIRAVSLLLLLATLDMFFVQHAYANTLIKGPSVQLVFGFEYAILMTVVLHVFVKYVLHTIDLQSENPWESKAVYLLYTEVALGFVKCLLYLVFLAIMIKVHTFPLFVIRPMYLTIREFKKALNDVVMSRMAIRNMNTLYPDATPEELAAGDNVCIICREEMHASCKKLPCNHIFHTSCLRSWFQRQQTCPTCRMDVLRPQAAAARAQPAAPVAAPAPQPAAAPQFPPHPMFQGWMGPVPPQQGFPGWFGGMQQPAGFPAWPGAGAAPGNVEPIPGAPPPGVPTPTAVGFMPPTTQFPPFMMMPPSPPVMFPYGGYPPMPAAPSLAGLSVEELRVMEGNERANVEVRVQCLRDIQVLLTAALTQMQQYTTVVGGGGGGPSGNINISASGAAKQFNLNSPAPTQAPPGVSLASAATTVDTSKKGLNSDTSEVLEGAVGGVELGGEYGAVSAEPAAVEDDGTASNLRRRYGVEPS